MTKHPSTTHFASYDNFPSAPHRVCLPPFANTNPSSHVGVHVCPIGKSEEQLPTPPFFGAREASQSDTSSTVKAFAAPSKRIHVINVVVVKKRRVPCRVINFTKGHFSLIVHTLLKRIIVSSVFLESRRRRRRRRQTKKKVIAHRYARCCCCWWWWWSRNSFALKALLVVKAFPKALFNNECFFCVVSSALRVILWYLFFLRKRKKERKKGIKTLNIMCFVCVLFFCS